MPENASCSGAATCSKESCEGCASKQNPRSMLEAMNAYSDIKHDWSCQWKRRRW